MKIRLTQFSSECFLLENYELVPAFAGASARLSAVVSPAQSFRGRFVSGAETVSREPLSKTGRSQIKTRELPFF